MDNRAAECFLISVRQDKSVAYPGNEAESDGSWTPYSGRNVPFKMFMEGGLIMPGSAKEIDSYIVTA